MSERIIDFDPLTGMRVTFEYNHDNDTFTIGHHQDAQPILEDNKWALLDLDTHKKQSKREWAHYAKIPEIVILEWKAKFGVDFMEPNHWKKVMSLINSPDYRYLKRTTYTHDR